MAVSARGGLQQGRNAKKQGGKRGQRGEGKERNGRTLVETTTRLKTHTMMKERGGPLLPDEKDSDVSASASGSSNKQEVREHT